MDQVRYGAAGRAVVPADCVRLSAEAVRVGAPGPVGREPTVQLVREDGVVRAIDVTCSCGERIRVRCEYD